MLNAGGVLWSFGLHDTKALECCSGHAAAGLCKPHNHHIPERWDQDLHVHVHNVLALSFSIEHYGFSKEVSGLPDTSLVLDCSVG